MKQIYLAGAMEVYDGTNKAAKWRKIAKEWFDDNYGNFKCISPVDYYAYGEYYHTNDSEVFRFDLHKVKESDVVLVNLHCIRKSIGTCDEILYAYLNDIPVIGFLGTDHELNEEELIKEIHPWKYIQINRIETGKEAFENAMRYIIGFYS